MHQFLRTRDASILAGLLLLVVILRLPNFFEPYWYGDEGIYLTIGNALNYGSTLYADIVDHKTPGIYWLAQVGTQLNFRILLTLWMLSSTVFFFLIARKLFLGNWSVSIASLLFVIFTTIPMFEGNIPNGELFVIGFVLLGSWLILSTSLGNIFSGKKISLLTNRDVLLLLGSGIAFGLALLIKVPALFDVLGVIALLYFAALRTAAISGWKSYVGFFQLIRPQFIAACLIIVAVAATIATSVGYFWWIGAGSAYLEFGLLYNFHYAANWDLSHMHPWVEWWLSLPGKATFLAVSGLTLSVITSQKLSVTARWLIMWSFLALVASLLSNRPYPHYVLQIIPPLALLIGYAFEQMKTKYFPLAGLCIVIVISVLAYWQVGMSLYPTISYYNNWGRMMTGQLDQTEYRNGFNYLMADNYRFAQLGLVEPGETLFIWGTNPMLYALTQTVPAGRFTVAFHIHDLVAYEETMTAVRAASPSVIVVQHDETQSLPGLEQLLEEQYRRFESFDTFTIWQRRDSNAY